jgi:hypothetical protein
MPDTRYIKQGTAHEGGRGFSGRNRQTGQAGRGITQQHSTGARQTQTQAKMMQRWGHQTAASTFTVPMAALLCLPWLWVAVKHLTRRGRKLGSCNRIGKV